MRKISKVYIFCIFFIILFICAIILTCKRWFTFETFDKKQTWFKGYFSVDLSGKVDFLKNDDSNVFVVFDSFNVTPADLCSLESAALHHPYSNTHAIFPTIDKKFVQIKSHIYVQLISNYNNLNFGIRENFITGSQSTSLEESKISLLAKNGGTLLDSNIVFLKPIRDISLVLKTKKSETDFCLIKLKETEKSYGKRNAKQKGFDLSYKSGLSIMEKTDAILSMSEAQLKNQIFQNLILLQTSNEAIALELDKSKDLRTWDGSRTFLKNSCPIVYASEIE